MEELVAKLLLFLEQGLQEEKVEKHTINAVTTLLWRLFESTSNGMKKEGGRRARAKERQKNSELQRVFNALQAPKIVLSLLCVE